MLDPTLEDRAAIAVFEVRNMVCEIGFQDIHSGIGKRPLQKVSQHARQLTVNACLAEHVFTPAQCGSYKRPFAPEPALIVNSSATIDRT